MNYDTNEMKITSYLLGLALAAGFVLSGCATSDTPSSTTTSTTTSTTQRSSSANPLNQPANTGLGGGYARPGN